MSEHGRSAHGGRASLARVLAGLGRRLMPRPQRRGDDLLAEGRWEEAAEAFRRAVGRSPGSFRAHLDLGTALSRLGRWEEAAAAYARAQEIDPSGSEVHLLRGMALAKLDRWQEVASASRLALERDPASAEAHVQLGNALLKAERWEEALSAYDRGLALAPGDAVASLNRGAALSKLERWDEAVKAYRRAAELQLSAGVFLNLGGALWKSGRLEEAAAAYRRAAELDGDGLDAHRNLGAVLFQLERWEEAAPAWQRASELDPGSLEAAVHCAHALAASRRWDGAVEALDRALALSPDRAATHVDRGVALSSLERWEEALAAFGRAARLAPASLPAHRSLAAALVRLERWDEAIPVARRMSELDPEDPEPHRSLGQAFLKLGRWDEAASSFRRAIERRPDEVDSHRNLGSALAKLGRWEEAAAACARAVAAAPADPYAYLQLGDAMSRLDRWQEAAAAYREGGRLAPDNPGFQVKLAEALERMGRQEEARATRGRVARLYFRGTGPVDEAVAAALRQRAATFWTPENLGPEVFRAERWLEDLANLGEPEGPPAGAGGAEGTAQGARDARLLFVLDDDYGELTTLMYLVLGQAFARRATLLLPDRLHAANGDALPGRTRRYGSVEDVLGVVEAERPQVVFLLSGYLYSIHGNMSLDSLERLVERLGELGCRVVTGDPFLGMLSLADPSRLIEIELPEDAHADYREAKVAQEALLRSHLPRSERILRGAYHLYPALDAAAPRAGPDARAISFFNPRLLLPRPSPGEGARGRAGAPGEGAAPHWLFILSVADFHTQTTFLGHARFADIVAAKLVEAREAGRHPILIAPGELGDAVIDRMRRADGVDVLRYCSFRRLISLLLTAEYAFYWNVVSHSILIRLFNGLPVILFDQGHLVRNVKPMYQRVVDCYYQGQEPAFLDHRRRLTVEGLAEHAAGQLGAADRMLEGYRRAPEPEQMIRAILDGPLAAGR